MNPEFSHLNSQSACCNTAEQIEQEGKPLHESLQTAQAM